MTNDPIAHWLQSHACIEEHGMLSKQLVQDGNVLYFEPVHGRWAVYLGCAEVTRLMRIGTCRELAEVQRIYNTILELNAPPVRVRVG